MATLTGSLSASIDTGATNASLAKLLPALQRLDYLIEQAVTAAQVAYGPEAAADRYRGLYINQRDVERLLERQPGAGTCQTAEALAASVY